MHANAYQKMPLEINFIFYQLFIYSPTDALVLLWWRYSPGWALASFTIRLQASRSLALSFHSFIPIFLRSVDTSSSHIIFGLAYSFPYIFFGIVDALVSCLKKNIKIYIKICIKTALTCFGVTVTPPSGRIRFITFRKLCYYSI